MGDGLVPARSAWMAPRMSLTSLALHPSPLLSQLAPAVPGRQTEVFGWVVTRAPLQMCPAARLTSVVTFRCNKKGHLEADLKPPDVLQLLALWLGREHLGDAMSTPEALSMTKTTAPTPSSVLGGPQETSLCCDLLTLKV